jgi:hypothetical protein
MEQEKLDFLQGIFDLEEKKVTDPETGIESSVFGFTYKELINFLENGDYPNVTIAEMFREVLFAHLSAGTAKLAIQGGIGECGDVQIMIPNLKDLIQLIKETSELIKHLHENP